MASEVTSTPNLVLPAGYRPKEELTPDQIEALQKMAEENPPAEDETNEPQGTPVATAFLVVIQPDNSVQISPDANIDIVLDRYPSPADLKHGCREALSQIERAELASIVVPSTAQAVQQAMIQGAQQLQQQQQGAQLASKVGRGFDPSLLKGGL